MDLLARSRHGCAMDAPWMRQIADAGFLRGVPTDPITQNKDCSPQFDEVVLSPDQTGTGMVDVHSNSDKSSPFDGTPYKDW